ncbi:MAG: AbrB/MazE/SpoVT family DNA-binding domain-containing protein [Candidatus Thorarchaeota archaeon]|nr:AbrB/MazE/SpoVT family DNA-binding domain-containing protein [Candidatus Thorarchaeota archaeon]
MGINVGMGITMGTERIDERGRITIPKDVRDMVGLKAGDPIIISAKGDKVTLTKAVDVKTFIQELRGCITVKGDIDPLDLKHIWRTVP